MNLDDASAVDRVIRARRTLKVLAESPLDVATDRALVEHVVASAGWAPVHLLAARVHRDGAPLPAIVPWRCHLLDAAACGRFRAWLLGNGEPSTMPQLLAACSALVLVTWLPDPPSRDDDGALFEGTRENMEHIAAASAAVQNMLLTATAHGLGTFWATALPFRTPESVAYLGIPPREILLGALYLTEPDAARAPGVETKAGALRERRGHPREWSRWIDLPDRGFA